MLRNSLNENRLIAIDATRSKTYGAKRFIRTTLNGLKKHTKLKIIVFVICDSFDSLESSRLKIVKLRIKQGGFLSIIYATIIVPMLAWWYKSVILYSPWDIGPVVKPVPFILGIHSPNCLTPKRYRSQKAPWLHEWLTKQSAKKAIAVEFPSYSAAKEIGDHIEIEQRKRKVIHHGAELTKWKKIIREIELSGSTNIIGDYFIYWSWFYRAKNIETLFHGFSEYKKKHESFKLVCAGKFVSEEYKNEINALIGSLDLVNNVIFVDQPSDEELVSLIYHSNAIVIPSLYETFGFMYVEGRVFKKPLIVADTNVAKEVTESQCIYFRGLDKVDLTLKMEEVTNKKVLSTDYDISEKFYEEYSVQALAKYFESFFDISSVINH